MTMLSDGFSPDFYLVGGNKILLFFNTYNEIVFVLFEERCAMISNVLMVPCIGHQVLYTVISGFSICLSPFNDECWRFNVFQGFWNLWNKVSTPMKCLVLEFFIDSTKNVFHIFDIYCNNLIIFLFFWKSVLCCVIPGLCLFSALGIHSSKTSIKV